MKRRPYLLLEVMIALSLVALCAIPLLRPLFAATRLECQHVRDLDQNLKAEQAFSDVRQLLYENKIPWDALPLRDSMKAPYTGQLSKYGCTYEIRETDNYIEYTTMGDISNYYRMLEITIDIEGKRFANELYAEQVSRIQDDKLLRDPTPIRPGAIG